MYNKNSSNDTIYFYYKRETLFKDVSLMSNFMAKNLASKEGNSLTDEYAISDDEQDLFDVCVQQVLPDIYEAMVKITSGVDSAFEASDTLPGSSTTDKYVIITIQDNDAYNDNVLSLVDASLYNALKIGTLKEVYSIIIQPDFFKVCAERFLGELFKLKQRLFQLKKKSITSNLT